MLRPLRPALQEKAIREVFEKPERINSDIKMLREWLEKQPHLQAVNPYYWKAKVESYRDWFLNEEECSDESLRPGKPRSSSSLFGVDGSFRQLDVD
ncbi:unnamed protein product [Danaus chrysippus]|uniref:(African queen) hypothetical protein n=1 Tax=Danaus chrysippus TaxID=151541 RepID=A0A8J2QP93_9NEOP|nr:unnamed protein product [Danaus chrysippus]